MIFLTPAGCESILGWPAIGVLPMKAGRSEGRGSARGARMGRDSGDAPEEFGGAFI